MWFLGDMDGGGVFFGGLGDVNGLVVAGIGGGRW